MLTVQVTCKISFVAITALEPKFASANILPLEVASNKAEDTTVVPAPVKVKD